MSKKQYNELLELAKQKRLQLDNAIIQLYQVRQATDNALAKVVALDSELTHINSDLKRLETKIILKRHNDIKKTMGGSNE